MLWIHSTGCICSYYHIDFPTHTMVLYKGTNVLLTILFSMKQLYLWKFVFNHILHFSLNCLVIYATHIFLFE